MIIKRFVALGLALSTSLAYAQPAPAPSPTPKAPASVTPPADQPPPTPVKTDEKAGANEQLHPDDNATSYGNVSAANKEAALTAFRDGNAQLNDGLFVKAVERYREALAHWDHPAIHYNLALALLNLDQPLDVYDALQKAIQYGPDPLEADKYEHAKEYILLVEKQLAWIEVSCDKVGAKVSVDGKEVFTAPGKYTQHVRIGKHTFYADKQGYNARITAPYIGPGEHFRIELKLYTAEELTRYRRKWETNTWAPWVVIGGGVLIGGAAVGAEFLAKKDYDDYNDDVAKCNQPAQGCSQNTPGITDKKKSGDTMRTVGYIGFGVAGAAVVTGVVLAIVNRRESYQITAEQMLNEKSVSVAPIVTPEMAGAMIQGHF